MATATKSRVSSSPIQHHACLYFEPSPNDNYSCSSLIDCRSRDASVSSGMSESSATSSVPQAPPWDEDECISHHQPAFASHSYDLPCEFEFLGCNQRFDPFYYESWISHTASHFTHSDPPPYAVCTFCDEEGSRFQDYFDPISNWRKRMIHIGGHLARGSCSDFRPDYWVIDWMWKLELLKKDDYAWAMKHAHECRTSKIWLTRELKSASWREEKFLIRSLK